VGGGEGEGVQKGGCGSSGIEVAVTLECRRGVGICDNIRM